MQGENLMATVTPATPHTVSVPTTYNIIDSAGLFTLPDPVWLIDHWCMRETITLLTGPSGSFKTFVALDLALKAATPTFTHFGPHYIDRSTATAFGGGLKVLYVFGESIGSAKYRVRAWERHNRVDSVRVPMLWHPDKMSLLLEGQKVRDTVDMHDPDIVIFDTWSRNTYGMDENNKQDVDKAMNLAHDLKKGGSRGGRSIIFLHHPPAAAGKFYRGHTSMLNDSDIMITTERFETESTAPPLYTKIRSVRQKETDDFEPYWATLELVEPLDYATGKPIPRPSGMGNYESLVVTDHRAMPVSAVSVSSTEDQMIEYIKNNPGVKPKDIQAELWPDKPTGKNVYEYTKKAMAEGKLARNIDGGFVVVPSTRATLEDL